MIPLEQFSLNQKHLLNDCPGKPMYLENLQGRKKKGRLSMGHIVEKFASCVYQWLVTLKNRTKGKEVKEKKIQYVITKSRKSFRYGVYNNSSTKEENIEGKNFWINANPKSKSGNLRKHTWRAITEHVYLSGWVYSSQNSTLDVPIIVRSITASSMPDLINKRCPLFEASW